MRRMGAAVRRRIATVRYRHCAQRPSGPGPAGRPGQSPGPACRGPALGVPGKDRERGAAQPECLSRLPIDGRPGSEANQPVADGSVPALVGSTCACAGAVAGPVSTGQGSTPGCLPDSLRAAHVATIRARRP